MGTRALLILRFMMLCNLQVSEVQLFIVLETPSRQFIKSALTARLAFWLLQQNVPVFSY